MGKKEQINSIIESKYQELMSKSGDKNLLSVTIPDDKYHELYKQYEEQIDNLPKILTETYNNIIKVIDYYLDIKEEYKKLIALWIIGTYCHDSFEAFPFLFLNAMRGSGKTRTLKLISHLSYKGDGQVTSGITESTLFRSEPHQTLVLDECESITGRDKSTLREYLQASYKKGANVKRAKKVRRKSDEDYEIVNFEPYRPIVMANISGMNEVLGDRCLTLVLEKSNNSAITKKIEDFTKNPDILRIKTNLSIIQCSLCSVVTEKNMITTWNDYIHYTYTTYTTYTTLTTLLTNIYKKIDNMNIDGRNLELIFPLLSIALEMGNATFDEVLEICKSVIEIKRTEEFAEDWDVSLIDYIANGGFNSIEYVFINGITEGFRSFIGTSDEEINTKWVGRALKRLNLTIGKKRVARGIKVLLAVERAKEKLKIFKGGGVDIDTQ